MRDDYTELQIGQLVAAHLVVQQSGAAPVLQRLAAQAILPQS